MNPEIDPSEDRDEFVRRIEKICCRLDHSKEYVEALMNDDAVKQSEIKESYLKQKAKMQHFLDAYDAGVDKEAKQLVVGQVTPDYKPTTEEIEAERNK